MRLYKGPGSTQDVDFVLVSQESKKVLQPLLLKALQKIEGLHITHLDLNSRGIFIEVADDREKALIEISIRSEMALPPEPLSTAFLSQKYAFSARVVSTMALPEAFAHKIAASLEREVCRDLFDLSQLEAMGSFDVQILQKRLSQLSLNRSKPIAMTFSQTADFLRNRAESLTQKTIERELHPLLPLHYRVGILAIVKASVLRIAQRLAIMPME